MQNGHLPEEATQGRVSLEGMVAATCLPPHQPALARPAQPCPAVCGSADSSVWLPLLTAQSPLWGAPPRSTQSVLGLLAATAKASPHEGSRDVPGESKLASPPAPPGPSRPSPPPAGHGRGLNLLTSPLDGSNTKNRLFMHHTKHTQKG
jgi:hypothetical protein